jgi:hypothetical protein
MRIYYSDTQKALMWDRWQKGDSTHAIARLFDRGLIRSAHSVGDGRDTATTEKSLNFWS